MAKRKRSSADTASTATAVLTDRDKKTMGRIVELADGVVTAAEKRRDPTLNVPARTLSNVKYNRQRRIIEMGTAKNARQLFNLAQARAYMQTLLVSSGS